MGPVGDFLDIYMNLMLQVLLVWGGFNRLPTKNDDCSHENIVSCDFFDVFVVLPFREHAKQILHRSFIS